MANNQNNNSQRSNDPISFELKEHISILSVRENGWRKEVNLIAWNGGTTKVDIRDWDPEHIRMSKGITLFEEEAEKLTKALAERYMIGGETPMPLQTSGSQQAAAQA